MGKLNLDMCCVDVLWVHNLYRLYISRHAKVCDSFLGETSGVFMDHLKLECFLCVCN